MFLVVSDSAPMMCKGGTFSISFSTATNRFSSASKSSIFGSFRMNCWY
jgi:hypothetical protein